MLRKYSLNRKKKKAIMAVRSKYTEKYMPLACIIKSMAISLAVSVPLFLITALAMRITYLPEEYISPAVSITVIVSIVLSSLYAGSYSMRFGGSICGFVYMFIVVIVRWSMEGGISFNTDILTMLLCGCLIGTIGGMCGINLRTRIGKRKKRPAA